MKKKGKAAVQRVGSVEKVFPNRGYGFGYDGSERKIPIVKIM